MLRLLVCGFAMLALGASLLYARQGVVKTKDGVTYEGDVTEKPDTVDIANVPGKPGVLTLNRGNIEKISYPDAIADEVHAALKKIDPKDVAQRLKIARLAYGERAYAAARDALLEAAQIDPGNKEVSDLLATITKLLPPPATMPATAPAVATTNPARLPPIPAVPPGAFVAKRLVTKAEVNRIKRIDWRIEELDPQSDEAKKAGVTVDLDTRKRFLAVSGMKPAEFNKLSQLEMAMLVLKGPQDLVNGVEVKSDPQAVVDFKKQPRTIISKTCAQCHSGQNRGNFHLFSGSDELSTYTNYLTLQNYSMWINGIQRSMIDRTNPQDSLLLQFVLDPSLGAIPHPNLATYPQARGQMRTKNDPRYGQLLDWITSLSPIAPKYGIDLNTDEQPKGRK